MNVTPSAHTCWVGGMAAYSSWPWAASWANLCRPSRQSPSPPARDSSRDWSACCDRRRPGVEWESVVACSVTEHDPIHHSTRRDGIMQRVDVYNNSKYRHPSHKPREPVEKTAVYFWGYSPGRPMHFLG